VLEHLPDTCRVVENVWHVLKPGGVATIRVPFAGSYAAWNDPTHVRHFTPATFRYFERGHDAQHYIGVEFSKVETRWIDDDSTRLARLRNRLPFRDTLCWLLWSMHDGIEARLTK
jgi:SAM-dependent methyltransferase